MTMPSSAMPPPTPTKPAVNRQPPRWERRLAGFVAAVGCLVVATAMQIDPYDDTGRPQLRGTHRQLGLAPCMMLSNIGFPCPSCGMTTSVSLLFHGDPIAACRANWAGMIVGCTGVAAIIWLGLLAAGMPRRPTLSAEATILAFTLLGAASATVRYLAIVAFTITQ